MIDHLGGRSSRITRAAVFQAAVLFGALIAPTGAWAQQQSQAVPPPAAPAAQAPPVRAYRLDLADEDWSFLANRAYRTDRFDPIKYISLFGGRSYLTLGGEARLRPEGLRVRPAPDGTSTVDNYVFQRYLFAADWHIGTRFRAYGEVQSGLINGKLLTRPSDKDVVDVHQAFVEFRSPKGRPRQFNLKIGRQEMTIGSSRLISAAQGLNVKRAFDGAVGGFRSGAWAVEGGVARLVGISSGAFDDTSSAEQTFWGGAIARRGFVFKGGTGGAYYLGVDRRLSRYAQGIGPERRHTVGGKFTGVWKAFDFNYDVIGQWGTFAGAGVTAWAVAAENSVRINGWPWRPRFTMRFNAASGDRDPADPRLQSMNPLFPGNSYSGAVGLLGPTNLTDVTPAVQFLAPRRIAIVVESPFYFRTSVRDAIYNIQLAPIIYDAASRDRFVGANPGVVVMWPATPHITVTGVITRFLPGDYVSQSFVAHGFGFYSSSITYRF